MAKYLKEPDSELDEVFLALSDPTRRAILTRLGSGGASVSALAEHSTMTLPSFMKHLNALERTGLIRTVKSGRVRRCELNRGRLDLIEGWLADQRRIWERRTDRLEQFVLTEHETRQTQEETP